MKTKEAAKFTVLLGEWHRNKPTSHQSRTWEEGGGGGGGGGMIYLPVLCRIRDP